MGQWHPTSVLLEAPDGLQSMGSLGVGHDWVTSLSLLHIGEGNGNPLQCSCLENPRDGGAWWAAVHGVAQSRTRLKRLSSSSSNKAYGTYYGSPNRLRRPSSKYFLSLLLVSCECLDQFRENLDLKCLVFQKKRLGFLFNQVFFHVIR